MALEKYEKYIHIERPAVRRILLYFSSRACCSSSWRSAAAIFCCRVPPRPLLAPTIDSLVVLCTGGVYYALYMALLIT
jgi:hypothetical protein